MNLLNHRAFFSIFVGYAFISTLLGLITEEKIQAQDATLNRNQNIHIAVASNFASTLRLLRSAYIEDHPSVEIIISSASTGKLTTQIRYGAPYDIFLAADILHPQLLIDENLALKASLQVYAQGQLALITHKAQGSSASIHLHSGKIRQIAIANSRTAPYGMAATQWLNEEGFDEQSFLYIKGENVNQAWQFFSQGGADSALVSLSQIILAESTHPFWILSNKDKKQLIQAAVVLKQGKNNEQVQKFMAYLRTKKALNIIEESGYRVNF